MTQVCSRCVMDSSAGLISFDSDGHCNYCTEFLQRAGSQLFEDPVVRDRHLTSLVEQIKSENRGRRYDCIMGLSGGVDSSFAIARAVDLGLRPLVVHMDNGWNSELAQHNIEHLVRGLNLDLVTYVIDWREYRSLMQSFFEADVIDVELLYDNAMYAVNYRETRNWRTRWILAGTNLATEGMRIPTQWNWLKYDKRNIMSIQRAYTRGRTRSFPAIGTMGYVWHRYFRRVQWVSFLDYMDFNKAAAIEELKARFGFKPYPHKHYESVFTRLYTGHILPTKFGVDKRRLDYSNLIISGQISRDEAIAALTADPYPSERDLMRDIQFFQKRLGWTESDWNTYLSRPERPHSAFATEQWRYRAIRYIARRAKLVGAP